MTDTAQQRDRTHRRLSGLLAGAVSLAVLAGAVPACADGEIKLGQTIPYSGPLSALSVVGKVQQAFFGVVNAEGGVGGKKINLLSLDDGYSPPKTLEMTRQLVEQDDVLAIFASIGTPTNAAIQKYLDNKKVPQLFITTGASRWADPGHFPWTMGWQLSYSSEARLFAKYIVGAMKDAKIAVLYQNDDSGKDELAGFKQGLGDAASSMIVSALSYETSDPTVDSQVIASQGSGATVFMNFATPKFAAQAIRRAAEIGWKPTQFLGSVSASVAAVLKPAGFDNAKGIIATETLKDPTDPAWADDPGMKDYLAFLKKDAPQIDVSDQFAVIGYAIGQTMVQVLKQCDGDVTRERLVKEAANLHHLTLPLLLPGIEINTSPTNYSPIRQAQLARFDGTTYVRFGEVIDVGDTVRTAK
jgi:branched-chain amino acid transport system substrate-binding protein